MIRKGEGGGKKTGQEPAQETWIEGRQIQLL